LDHGKVGFLSVSVSELENELKNTFLDEIIETQNELKDYVKKLYQRRKTLT
jgi:hypothetical protein